jgi:hypothetical protein
VGWRLVDENESASGSDDRTLTYSASGDGAQNNNWGDAQEGSQWSSDYDFSESVSQESYSRYEGNWTTTRNAAGALETTGSASGSASATGGADYHHRSAWESSNWYSSSSGGRQRKWQRQRQWHWERQRAPYVRQRGYRPDHHA